MLSKISSNVRAASIGGESRVRQDDRQLLLSIDQWIGQIGEAGLSIWFYGNMDEYFRARDEKNKHPEFGDNGWDLLGFPVDIKTSNARFKRPLTSYRLPVPPAELHDVIYILGLVRKQNNEAILHMPGWADKHLVTLNYSTTGTFKHKYYVDGNMLNGMDTCRDAILRLKDKLASLKQK
jgi:hypothetical protein